MERVVIFRRDSPRTASTLEISKFGFFRQFCVQEFSADLELHEVALQRGKLGIL